jgi:UDP-glucose:(heptosyl)LPS alpha-1,3-glucosyltransferase
VRLGIVRRQLRGAGGAERFIVETARALAHEGVEVTLLSEGMDADARPAAQWARLPPGRGTRARRYRAFQTNVAAALAAADFDIVQTHERVMGAHLFRLGDGVHAAFLDRLKRSRAAWRRPFMDLDAFHRLLIASERAMALDTGTLFVANSALVARDIAAWLPVPEHRVRIIENGVDLGRFALPSPAERAAARERLGIPVEGPVVAFVGSGFERKGAFPLVVALANPALHGVILLIAGRDKQAAALRRIAGRMGVAERVRFLGPLEDVRPVLHAADLLALPTLYDPMPNAAIEAIACGLPVVTTADAGIADHVEETGAGAVAIREPDALAVAIASVLVRLEAASAAARALRLRFDVAQKTREWITLYREVVAR